MISMKRKDKTNGGILPSVLYGSASGIMVSCAAALVCPIFILNGYIPHSFIPVMTLIIQFLGAVTGAMVAGSISKENKIYAVLICAATMFVAAVSCGMLFFTGDLSKIVSGLICYIAGGFCSILIINTQNKGRRKKRTKRRSR